MSATLDRDHVRNVIDTYIRAWTTQDPELIVTIFTADATYHEKVLEEPWVGEAGIRGYWETRVVNEEANIEVELLALYLDGNTAIAEWEAKFDFLGVRKRMREVAILEFDGDRIASLREYWKSETIR